MGNDGGSIPTRRDLVKDKQNGLTTSQLFDATQDNADFDWKNCPVSKKPLQQPIVSCYKGRLYNKDAVIEWLLDKDESSVAAQVIPHVQSLKDIVELKFETSKEGDWMCPLSQREVKALTYRFVYVAETGWVYSESAIREFSECPQGGVPFSKDNLVLINPIRPEDKDAAKTRLVKLVQQGLTHGLKKTKKEKKEKKEKKNKKKEFKVVKP